MKTQRQCHMKTETPFYRIGVFAQMNKVTIKTLRHYDETGLVTYSPSYVKTHIEEGASRSIELLF